MQSSKLSRAERHCSPLQCNVTPGTQTPSRRSPRHKTPQNPSPHRSPITLESKFSESSLKTTRHIGGVAPLPAKVRGSLLAPSIGCEIFQMVKNEEGGVNEVDGLILELDSECSTDEDSEDNALDDKACAESEIQYKRIVDLMANDILGLEFGSDAEACEFYRIYARLHGFVMRRDDVKRDSKGNIIIRQLVCNREGKHNEQYLNMVARSREHRPLTHTNCPARIRVNFDYNTSKWKVGGFEEGHNHDLTEPQFIHLVPAYCQLSQCDKTQVDNLHEFGVKTCHIMRYIAGQKGGHAHLGFTKKDLYNHIERHKQSKVKGGDSNAGISYLRGKAGNDPLFFGKYTKTLDDRLENLFWADGCSIIDYECFGDVLAFDTTYKKNRYNKPLVIFSGSNHHAQTTIFGCALVSNETVDTYKWLLETFLEAMGNKHPKTVVTDGDAAMRDAIGQVFPNSTHRLCAWHLQNNACENVKNPAFLRDFKNVIYSNFTVEEFEDRWKEIVEKHSLSSNKWVLKTHETRMIWVHAYLRDDFFGHIRPTSQCEGINSFIKAYVRKKNSIIEFVNNIDIVLREYRNNDLVFDFNSVHYEPVLTTSLKKIEHFAAKTYTHNIFREVRSEIERAGALNVVLRSENGEKLLFRMNTFCSPDEECEVVFDRVAQTFCCDYRLFESRGILCCHIFCVLRQEHIDAIPDSLIYKRWRKTAKSEFIYSAAVQETDYEKTMKLRLGALAVDCNQLCDLACKSGDSFVEIKNNVNKLINKLKLRLGMPRKHDVPFSGVGDPLVVKTKGASLKLKKKMRHCSSCHKAGHTYRKCPKLANMCSDTPFHEEEHREGSMSDECSKEAHHKSDNCMPQTIGGKEGQHIGAISRSITGDKSVPPKRTELTIGQDTQNSTSKRDKLPNTVKLRAKRKAKFELEFREQNRPTNHDHTADMSLLRRGELNIHYPDVGHSPIAFNAHNTPAIMYPHPGELYHTIPPYPMFYPLHQPPIYPQYIGLAFYPQISQDQGYARKERVRGNSSEHDNNLHCTRSHGS